MKFQTYRPPQLGPFMRGLHSGVCLIGVLLVGLSIFGQPGRDMDRRSQSVQSDSAAPTGAANVIYLPLVVNGGPAPRVNVPHFAVANIFPEHYAEMALFWLGRVTPAENYADVRVGYSDTALEVRVGIIDRLLWLDSSPAAADLEAWDGVTLYLDTNGTKGGAPGLTAYRFVSQLSFSNINRGAWQAAYRGNGATWVTAAAPFTTTSGWRGDSPNNNSEDRGWEAGFKIPFTSLGLSGPPAEGMLWAAGVALHDRDDSAGSLIADQLWPETLKTGQPQTWGELRFGLPGYGPPPVTVTHTVLIREGLAGAHVPDAALGGTIGNLCPGSSFHIWNEWGNWNYSSSPALNIQNERDISDWPCFAKYYVMFPLDGLPRGRNIVSATLTLHHWGNSGDPEPGHWNSAEPSFIQVLTVPPNWSAATLTWNNAPQPLENVSQAWVPVVSGCTSPCAPRNWDVSYAVSKAYAAGGLISFALYSSDAAYDSGKFFTSSDAAEWEAVGRPTLTVVWGEP